ncbi:NCS2 family permease [Bacillus fonticola]|uniref:NCS2 family permease n=1 Tax=Bacillus fonticola TaxID=2728853 RepID=UPI001473AC8E|nr:NCS2 family permease [Bacillus fonticola]
MKTSLFSFSKKECLAGVIGFFTTAYIIAVNSFILQEAGVPAMESLYATILSAVIGCLLMGFYAKTPILIIPGMGINALFTYTVVGQLGLSWQEALLSVVVSGAVFSLLTFTKLTGKIITLLPASLKYGMTVGLGLYIFFIGLEMGGLIVAGDSSLVRLGDLTNRDVLWTMAAFLLMLILFVRKRNGYFFIGLVVISVASFFTGDLAKPSGTYLPGWANVFAWMTDVDASVFLSSSFWIAVFTFTLVLLFENIGLVEAHTRASHTVDRYVPALRGTALSTFFAGLVGSSPTVASIETQAVIQSGGKSGGSAIVTGILFIASFFMLPLISIIPTSAIAAILLIIGFFMILDIQHIPFDDVTEAFPAVFLLATIPFTQSIIDGMAIGFLLYPIVKIGAGKWRDVNPFLAVSAFLFFVYFLLQAFV